jgi:hypothetical protein
MCRARPSPLFLPPVLDAFLFIVLAHVSMLISSSIHTSWNLHQHTSRAILSPASYSSKQIIHSASPPSASTQSFSVAVKGSIPRAARFILLVSLAPSPTLLIPRVRWAGKLADVCWVRGTGAGDAECNAIHSSICCVRSASSFSGPLGGSSLPQIGHSSSSAIWRLGRGGCWVGRADGGTAVNADRGNMLTTD